MLERLGRWRKIPLGELSLLLQVMILLPVVAMALRLGGYGRTVRWLSRWPRRRPIPPTAPDALRQAVGLPVRALARAKRRAPYRGKCLSQSVTLWWLLHCRGLDSAIRIGAAHRATGFDAHAWVEFQGHVLNDSADVAQRYTVIPGPPNYLYKL